MNRFVGWAKIRWFKQEQCACMQPPFQFSNYDRRYLGIDSVSGGYGDVSILTCKKCGSRWLNYALEYEGYSQSGRWYRCLLPPVTLGLLRPDTAVDLLESSSWYFQGGPYFSHSGVKSRGPLRLNP